MEAMTKLPLYLNFDDKKIVGYLTIETEYAHLLGVGYAVKPAIRFNHHTDKIDLQHLGMVVDFQLMAEIKQFIDNIPPCVHRPTK